MNYSGRFLASENGLKIFSKRFFVSEREEFQSDILEGRVGFSIDARTHGVSRQGRR